MDTVERKPLTDKHLAKLKSSGLSDETIAASGIYSTENNVEVMRLIGWTSRIFNWNSCMVIPYGDGYCRIRPDFPRTHEGRVVKYESPMKHGNRAYFPAGFTELFAKSKTVIATEGELKGLSIQQHTGQPCIGLAGVWSWQQKRPKDDSGKQYGKRRLIDDLQKLDWTGKTVIVVFDSDAATNDLVRFAECSLSLALTDKGAKALVARIPADGDEKVGADDYLVKHGADAFKAILEAAEEAEEPEPPNLMDMARMYLAERHDHPEGPTVRWWRGQFHAWTGTYYRDIPDAEIDGDILQWMDERHFNPTPKRGVDVRKCLASEVRVSFALEQPVSLTSNADNKSELIAMRNGVISLDEIINENKLQLRPHTPTWFSSFALPYDFDPTAKCPVWSETLNGIFDGDEERMNLLGEWFGYSLTSDTTHHGVLMLEGPPRSGKSTILRTLVATIGKANVATPSLTSLSDTFGLWPLVGKRLAVFPDAHLGHGANALGVLERVKSISGEDAVDVHRKNLPTLTNVRLGTRFALSVNELPKFGDSAGALGPRIHILPCRNSFVGREDRDLERKILAELPGIFCWSIQGLARLQDQGRFTKPDVSKEIEADFARLVSPLKAFIEEHCTIRPGAECPRDLIWESWKEWAEANGHKAGSNALLGSRLRAMLPGLDTAQRREDDARTRYYIGIELKRSVNV